jgi:Stress responsive A/B Barrel Domain
LKVRNAGLRGGTEIGRVFSGKATEAMYIHLFAFRFKAGVTEEQKERVVTEIGKLRREIPQMLEAWVGKNDSPRGQGYELGGVMKFADKAACEAYGAHPVHQKLLVWLMPLIEPIEVDFPVTK